MRISLRATAALIWITLAVPANAAVLSLAGSTLDVTIAFLPSLSATQSPDPISILVSSGTGGFTEPAGIFPATTVLATQLFTGVPVISSLNMTANNATGSFAAGGGLNGGFGGPKPLTGSVTMGVLSGLVNMVIPLGNVGFGGVFQQVLQTPFKVTITGATWTTGVAKVTGIISTSENGAIVNTVTLTGYDNRTAGHRGTLMLVSPARIITGPFGNLPLFAVQTLTFVPEPGIAILLGSVCLAVVVAGRRRREP